MAAKYDLKECPFCGESVRIVQSNNKEGEISNRFIFCDGCTCVWEFAHIVPVVELVAGWNRRPDIKAGANLQHTHITKYQR